MLTTITAVALLALLVHERVRTVQHRRRLPHLRDRAMGNLPRPQRREPVQPPQLH
jgi:hypothetical protein